MKKKYKQTKTAMFSWTDQSSGGNLRFPSASLFLEPFVLFFEEESSATWILIAALVITETGSKQMFNEKKCVCGLSMKYNVAIKTRKWFRMCLLID